MISLLLWLPCIILMLCHYLYKLLLPDRVQNKEYKVYGQIVKYFIYLAISYYFMYLLCNRFTETTNCI